MKHLHFLNNAESAEVKRLQEIVVKSSDEQQRKRSITQIILIIERAKLRLQQEENERCNV
ncbi:hypothetical protein [Alkalicoccobacillus porphyridii]|uniref:Uncharacterized protein n=1 Tax=Alkalicoccobacillus porphyridii TaxID=2597270 RepID=A0A553ZXM1_9BACI|nr:hypothetical protein [Alkalicoccobacillus porphyridii]TSB46199.1 hypothetical protein FN960_12620 [Alkalicoccobacillus porphyridii]